jgi:hypothetical protein
VILNDSVRYFKEFTELMFAKSYFDDRDNLVKSQTQDIDPIR